SAVADVSRDHRRDVQLFRACQVRHLIRAAMNVQVAGIPALAIHVAESRNIDLTDAGSATRHTVFFLYAPKLPSLFHADDVLARRQRYCRAALDDRMRLPSPRIGNRARYADRLSVWPGDVDAGDGRGPTGCDPQIHGSLGSHDPRLREKGQEGTPVNHAV